MQVPLLDLKQQYLSLENEFKSRIGALCASQQFILGPRVEELERQVAAYCGAAYGCGLSSGSDALLISLMAENIGAGDEVITTPYTFFATVGAICRTGATPVFVDIDPVTYNIDVNKIEERITSRTKAIIPVHLYGQASDMASIYRIARKHNIIVIEDACQAIGAEYDGKRVCSEADYGCLSFFPSKNLGCFGDGGMTVCNTEARNKYLKILRNHGMAPQYHHHVIGGNFRLDALQAEVLLVKLPHLDKWTEMRQQNAADYRQMLADVDGITLPGVAPWCTRHVCNQFVIRVKDGRRDRLWDELKAAGIGCAVYYPVPLHMQECFAGLGIKEGEYPESEAAARETLALPIFPELTMEQKEYVARKIAELLK